jgi:hypothetical protein
MHSFLARSSLSLGAVDANLSNIASERGLMGNRCCFANVLEIPNRDTYTRMRNIPVGRCRHLQYQCTGGATAPHLAAVTGALDGLR